MNYRGNHPLRSFILFSLTVGAMLLSEPCFANSNLVQFFARLQTRATYQSFFKFRPGQDVLRVFEVPSYRQLLEEGRNVVEIGGVPYLKQLEYPDIKRMLRELREKIFLEGERVVPEFEEAANDLWRMVDRYDWWLGQAQETKVLDWRRVRGLERGRSFGRDFGDLPAEREAIGKWMDDMAALVLPAGKTVLTVKPGEIRFGKVRRFAEAPAATADRMLENALARSALPAVEKTVGRPVPPPTESPRFKSAAKKSFKDKIHQMRECLASQKTSDRVRNLAVQILGETFIETSLKAGGYVVLSAAMGFEENFSPTDFFTEIGITATTVFPAVLFRGLTAKAGSEVLTFNRSFTSIRFKLNAAFGGTVPNFIDLSWYTLDPFEGKYGDGGIRRNPPSTRNVVTRGAFNLWWTPLLVPLDLLMYDYVAGMLCLATRSKGLKSLSYIAKGFGVRAAYGVLRNGAMIGARGMYMDAVGDPDGTRKRKASLDGDKKMLDQLGINDFVLSSERVSSRPESFLVSSRGLPGLGFEKEIG